MKAIILAAGYATRLYPLTLNKPKALLPVGPKSVLDYILDQLEAISEINEIIVVSNHKFIESFKDWQKSRISSKPLRIFDDGTICEAERLGAIGDIHLVIEKEEISEDVLILAGDNIFTFSLLDYIRYFQAKKKDCILVQRIKTPEGLKGMGIVTVDSSNRVVHFEEKPQIPKSDIGAFALYIYRKDTLPLFKQYLEEGNKADAPGYFPEWLYSRKELYAYFCAGQCFDIGTPESYQAVKQVFKVINKEE